MLDKIKSLTPGAYGVIYQVEPEWPFSRKHQQYCAKHTKTPYCPVPVEGFNLKNTI